jgi:type I restriction enzyme S subunit
MSRIDDLIRQHCPEGVDHRMLGEIAHYSRERVSADSLDESSFVGVDNLIADKGGKIPASYSPNSAMVTSYNEGDVLIGNIRPYLKKIWLADNAGGCSGDVLAVRRSVEFEDRIDPPFLYYVLSSDAFFSYNMQNAKGAKMPRGSKEAILKFRIPVPPLEVQWEIVRVLDLFQSLEAELEAELEARRRQYAHYRDSLLDFTERGGVRWMTLDEVCRSVSSGGTPLSTRPDFYGGGIPWLRTQEVLFNEIFTTDVAISEAGLAASSAKWIPANCVIVAISGATAARVAINRIPMTTNQHCCNLEVNESVANHRYVYQWLCREYFNLKALGQGARSDLNSGIIRNFHIAVPELAEQNQIVEALEKFDALVNDLSIGLPAELAARRSQYEYYRDRLLTFEEAA